ncbi:hypothetical protein H310_14302 [Aphanomyces invadans]|uniref:Myb/SANT-like domain-containing protein n=1 Tax=Aphanomyces invadans TaxID=157072 RepID=A0A024TAA2_9STRA|nr:hypothetical protein H310_14302 [Aphanomyces invadans]ETV90958.1 hypothetical protein H310_14302 [Aphanomyces invadans]|eukprot:XP_008880347.1 hypothetical protein H310_14302 [Aphanomyces invadans]
MGLWTDDLDVTWLKELVHQAIVLGKQHGQEIPLTLQQLKSRHDTIKGSYSVIAKIVNSSGMGWEATTCKFDLCEALVHGTLAHGNFVVTSTEEPSSYAPDQRDSSIEDAADMQGDESDAEECQHDDSGAGRRSSLGDGGKLPNKRQRLTMASQLLQCFQGMGASSERELELMAEMIKPTTVSPTAKAVKLLHEELGEMLSVDDTMMALDVLENETRAVVFMSMQPGLRETWILRQVEKLRNA